MFYLVLICIFSVFFGKSLENLGCSVSVNTDLSDPEPLLLLQNDATEAIKAFPLPQDNEGTLIFPYGESIDIACPGGTVIADSFNMNVDVVEAVCNSSTTFIIQNQAFPLNKITCSKSTSNIARYTGNTCATTYKEIEIGFQIKARFIRHIVTCFDHILQNSIYSVSTLTRAIAGSQINYPRPSFKVGEFYNVDPDTVNDLYTQDKQRFTINQILHLAETNVSVIQPHSNYYLARGHLTPKVSFIYGAQQRLTFYYVNAAPQWQTFNEGNWYTIESNCRNLASSREINLIIYTGTYGVSALPDIYGNEQSLYLWKNNTDQQGIPVPALFYKVVYEPISKMGIVILGVNNPYLTNVSSLIICTDVSDKVSWLTWKNKNITLGFGYCCEVDDFRKTVTVLPQFPVYSLLV